MIIAEISKDVNPGLSVDSNFDYNSPKNICLYIKNQRSPF